MHEYRHNLLRHKIEREIREHGPIPFSRYMELCLYDPELGYYARGTAQFGKAGDFYTSSDVHAVFGRLLARQFEEMWRTLGPPEPIELLELGPGRGLFAQDVLDWSEKKFPKFFRALHYRLAESSPALRARITETLAPHFEAGKCTLVETLQATSLPQNNDRACHPEGGREPESRACPELAEGDLASDNAGKNTSGGFRHDPNRIIFANEFFDALPVEVLSEKGSLRVDVRDGQFVETWSPASTRELEYMDRYSIHPEPGERVEVALHAQNYAVQAAELISRGFFIVIDYGYTRDELLAGRHRGTIMAYRQHSASPNPYEAPGEQDITAHVNFTALAAAMEENGLRPHKLLTQSQFLMGIGESTQFADALEDCRLPQERAKVALQLKHLVTPAGMGETFHVLVASKGIGLDVVSRLSGLRFGRKDNIGRV